jgi:hypothetical protein
MLLSHRVFRALPADQQLPVVWQQGHLVAERARDGALRGRGFLLRNSLQPADRRHPAHRQLQGLVVPGRLLPSHPPARLNRFVGPVTAYASLLNAFSTAGSADDLRISVATDFEVRYWTRALGCTAPQLHAAIAAVGPMLLVVRKYLAT